MHTALVQVSNPVARYAAYLALLTGVSACQGGHGQEDPQYGGRELGELAPPPPPPIVEKGPCCQKKARVGDFNGHLLDSETQAPIRQGELRLSLEDGRSFQLATDQQGAFRLEEVPAGYLEFTVHAPGYASSSCKVYFRGKNLDYDFPLHKLPTDQNVSSR